MEDTIKQEAQRLSEILTVPDYRTGLTLPALATAAGYAHNGVTAPQAFMDAFFYARAHKLVVMWRDTVLRGSRRTNFDTEPEATELSGRSN